MHLDPAGLVGGRRTHCPLARARAADPGSGTCGTWGKQLCRGWGGGRRCWGVGERFAKPKKAEKPWRRWHCCAPALPASLRPLPARRLNMNIVGAGSFPGALNMLPISYKYFCRCPLARGRLGVCSSLRPASAALRGLAGSGGVWCGLAGIWWGLAGIWWGLAGSGGVWQSLAL